MRTFFNKDKSNCVFKNNYNLIDGNKMFFYALICGILMTVVSTILFTLISGIIGISYAELASSRFGNYYSIIIMAIVYFCLFIFYNKKNKINPVDELGIKNKVNVWFLLISVMLGVCCIFLLAPFVNLLFDLFKIEGQPLPYEMNSWYSIILGIIGYAVLPAISEELIFRGVIQSGAKKRFTPVLTVFFSTACFTLMHGSLQQTFYQIVLGMVAGVLFYFSKNILYPIIFHFLNNFSVVIFELVGMPNYLQEGYFNYSTAWGVIAPILLLLLCSGLFLAVYFLLKHISKKVNTNTEFIMEGENIIYEEQSQKLSFKNFISGQTSTEKTYFVFAFVIALVMWISNTIEMF